MPWQDIHITHLLFGSFWDQRQAAMGRFLPVTTDRFGSVRALEGLCADLTALIFELLR